MPKRNSSVVGREFGNGVRHAIEQSGLTQRKLAELLDWQEAKVSDLVQGKGGVDEAELRELLAYCRADRDEARRLVALFNESREKGYLQFIEGGVLVPLRTLIEQERLTNKITTWFLTYLPGLLQTAGYIRALMANSAIIKPTEVDDAIRLKLGRQVVFHRSRELVFYVHENALRLPVGGPDVMQTQLLHILTMTMRPYLTVRVVPMAIGAHAGGAGSFVKLEYAKFAPAIWLESLRTGLFLEDKETLSDYDDLLESLDEQALDVDRSREMIASHLPRA
jgi:predicted XRE-type DNA-binding protein